MKLYYAKTFTTQKGKYLYDALLEALYEVNDKFYNIINSRDIGVEDKKYYENYIEENNIRDILVPVYVEISHDYNANIIKNIINSHKKLLILSITNKCNMDCTYCIYHEKFHKASNINHTMSFETAVKAIDHLLRTSLNLEQIHVGFYGGESLLEFELIKKCVEYIGEKNNGIKITFGTTTNGILLADEKIRRYFEKYNFQVNISLDGPKIINDRYRVTKSGKGSYETIISNLKLWYTENPKYVKEKVTINIVEAPPVYFKVLDDFFNGFPVYYSYSSLFSTPYFDSHIINYESENMKKVTERKNMNYSKKFSDEFVRSFKNYIPRNISEIPSKIIPGGVCIPVYMRWYVNSRGEYYPCERIAETEEFCIGNVDTDVDFEKVVRLFDNYLKVAKNKCEGCWAFKLCGRCFKNIEEDCDELLTNLEERYVYYIEHIKDNKKAIEKINAISYLL